MMVHEVVSMLCNLPNKEQFLYNRNRDDFPNPNIFEMHAHTNYELLVFLSGQVTYLVEGNRYTPKPYDVLLYNIAETHKPVVDPSVPYERIVLYLDKEFLSGVDRDGRLLEPFRSRPLGENNLIHAEAFPDNFWRGCLQRLECARKDDPLQILSALLPLLQEVGNAASRIIPHAPEDRLSVQIVNFVNDNITLPLTSDSIAAHFYISRSLLYSQFKKATGTSIHNYIRAKRLIMARQLISAGISPVDACWQCGFSDYTTFFRGYKARFGTSPKDDIPK